MKGYMYILECANGCYYTSSTNDLECRLEQHQNGEGANFTKKHCPVKLVYFEEFQRIDLAFNREKQVQGWSRKKKEALINGFHEKLPELSLAYRDLAVVVPFPEAVPFLETVPFPEALEGNAVAKVASRTSATGHDLATGYSLASGYDSAAESSAVEILRSLRLSKRPPTKLSKTTKS